jgi:hypothetical protein
MIMTIERQMHLVSRFGLMGALLIAAVALPACAGNDADLGDGDEDVEEAESAIGPDGSNNYPPYAVDSDPLKRSVTNSFNLTTSGNADPLPLCAGGTVTSTGCTLKAEWKSWMDADATNRVPTMTAIAKCAVESSFTIQSSSGSFAGQWGLYQSWKTNRLNGQDKRERISSCMLTLLNGNNVELTLCIIGPGGAPFSDACSDPALTMREGGFFGDLFAASPTAYVAGPDSAEPVDSGRACFASSGIYCCAEQDTACAHRIVLTGAILGSPDQAFANKRCNAPLVNSGGNQYCPSFYSTREPGRSYTNVFTTFVPSPP